MRTLAGLVIAAAACLAPSTALRMPSVDWICDRTPEPGAGAALPALPTRAERLELATAMWRLRRDTLLPVTPERLEQSEIAYALQYTGQDFFRLALHERRLDLADEVLDLTLAYRGLFRRADSVEVHAPDGRSGWRMVNYPKSYDMLFASGSRREAVLAASQLFGFVGEAIRLIAMEPADTRTAAMNRFVRAFVPLLLSNLERWASAKPGLWQNVGYGCPQYGMTLVEYMDARHGKPPPPRGEAYCNAIVDTELWIVVAAVELSAAIRIDPALGDLAADGQMAFVRSIIDSGVSYFADSLVKTSLHDERGAPVTGLVIDPGAWATHPEHVFAGYEGDDYPDASKRRVVPTLSWDLSHSYRLVPALLGLAEAGEAEEVRTRFDAFATLFANQIVHRVFNGDVHRPRFRNFIDGSNGWYRVAYDGRDRFAYPPWALSIVMATTPYMRLAQRNPRLREVAAVLWSIVDNPTGPYCRIAHDQYAVAELHGGKRQPSRLFGPDRTGAVLPFVATVPTRD